MLILLRIQPKSLLEVAVSIIIPTIHQINPAKTQQTVTMRRASRIHQPDKMIIITKENNFQDISKGNKTKIDLNKRKINILIDLQASNKDLMSTLTIDLHTLPISIGMKILIDFSQTPIIVLTLGSINLFSLNLKLLDKDFLK